MRGGEGLLLDGRMGERSLGMNIGGEAGNIEKGWVGRGVV